MTSSPNLDWPTQQLAEFVAKVSSIRQEGHAIRAAVEAAAEALEAEIALMVHGDVVFTQVGVAKGQAVPPGLASFREPAGGRLEVMGLGRCCVVAAPLAGDEQGWLIVARRGDDEFDAAEQSLLRGMARVAMMVVNLIRSAAALRQSEQRTLEILETAGDAFVSVDSEGAITAWNRRAEAIFGVDRSDVLGKSLVETIVPHQDRLAFEHAFARLKTGQGEFFGDRLEISARRADKSEFPAEVTLWGAGKLPGASFNALIRDISERKHAENILKRAYEQEREIVHKLQQLDEIKMNFVSSVSHELRTPLTSIVGYLELLREEEGSFTESQRESLSVIDRNSRRLLDLIEDVLTLSRIESGRFEIRPGPLSLPAVVEEVVTAVSPLMKARSLELRVNLDGVKDVVADGAQLERVLFNLMTNAIKFTPDGGVIGISARRDAAMASVTVSDTGIGIAPEDQAKLFEYFYRTTTAHALAIPGTGLGLAIVKNIVEKHGGKVSLESRPGKGTTATFTIPVDGPWAERPPGGGK